MAESLYVCQFSNGHIKVGRSLDPFSRIASHAARVACVGVELVEHSIFECEHSSDARERNLIVRCADACSQRHSDEWFAGLEYLTVCEWARQEAAAEVVTANRKDVLPLYERRALAAQLGMTMGVLLQALNGERPPGPIMAVRIEQATAGRIRRWDLRPADWHLIWPELIGIDGAPKLPEPAADKAGAA